MLSAIPIASAQETILPQGAEGFTDDECLEIINSAHINAADARSTILSNEECTSNTVTPCSEELFSCGIKTGDIHLWMLPYYITHIVEFLIGIVGIVSVGFVIIGGYFYAWGGLTEDKEKGKKTVMYALIGLAHATMAWVIVNIVQTQLTS